MVDKEGRDRSEQMMTALTKKIFISYYNIGHVELLTNYCGFAWLFLVIQVEHMLTMLTIQEEGDWANAYIG